MAAARDMNSLRVLVVEDDALVRAALERTLQRYYAVWAAASVEQALSIAKASRIDVVLTDLDLADPQGRSGLWLLDQLCDGTVTRGLALTGQSTEHPRHPILRKPATSATLRTAIEAVAARPPQAPGQPGEVE